MMGSAGRQGGVLAIAALSVLALVGCAPGTSVAPETAPSLSTTSGSEAYHATRAKGLADYLKVKHPPTVEIVRYVSTQELDAVLKQCLAEEGYPTGSHGGIDYPPDQEENFRLAQYTCYMRYPIPEKYAQAWTNEQIRAQYSWTVEFVIPCLEEKGHPISEPPSESVFLDTWASAPFFPFSQVRLSVSDDQVNASWDALEGACPQQAPDEVLWDGLSAAEWEQRKGVGE